MRTGGENIKDQEHIKHAIKRRVDEGEESPLEAPARGTIETADAPAILEVLLT